MHSDFFNSLREQFPGLKREVAGTPAIFFDGPAGSQVPQSVVDAVMHSMIHCNANHDGPFATSIESDQLLDDAHAAMADLIGADDPRGVAFGANMTTLTLALSRAMARTWKAGDEILLSQLEHDANVTPWVLAARDAGAIVRHVSFNPEDCTVNLDDYRNQLTDRTKLVAFCCASNIVGTINPVQEMTRMAHDAGAKVFVDAVHFAPHSRMDVAAWGCDFLACSAYKFFGPHVGILWGRPELLADLPVYKLRPSPESLPGRWMTGTQNHEGINGTRAAVEYLAGIGRQLNKTVTSRKSALSVAFEAIELHEQSMCCHLLKCLRDLSDWTVLGINESSRAQERCPTVSMVHERWSTDAVAKSLADRGIFVWGGNHYALPVTETLGLEPGGTVRIGILHYNNVGEIDRLVDELADLSVPPGA